MTLPCVLPSWTRGCVARPAPGAPCLHPHGSEGSVTLSMRDGGASSRAEDSGTLGTSVAVMVVLASMP